LANLPLWAKEVPTSFRESVFLVEMPVDAVVKKKIIQNELSKTFFIFSAIPKVKYYWLREPYKYHHWLLFTRIGDFTWRVSDCEELVEGTH